MMVKGHAGSSGGGAPANSPPSKKPKVSFLRRAIVYVRVMADLHTVSLVFETEGVDMQTELSIPNIGKPRSNRQYEFNSGTSLWNIMVRDFVDLPRSFDGYASTSQQPTFWRTYRNKITRAEMNSILSSLEKILRDKRAQYDTEIAAGVPVEKIDWTCCETEWEVVALSHYNEAKRQWEGTVPWNEIISGASIVRYLATPIVTAVLPSSTPEMCLAIDRANFLFGEDKHRRKVPLSELLQAYPDVVLEF